MKNFIQLVIVTCVFFILNDSVSAQAARIAKGVVKDESENAIEGATVVEKGVTSNATTTDKNGAFTLQLKGSSNSVIISFVGFQTLELKAAVGQIKANLRIAQGSEVVVIGYQSQKRRNLTAAVSSISGKDIKDIPQSSFDQTLQGRLAGVSVLSSSGELGAKTSIIIRGATNIDYGNANGGNTGPLYVIDGVIYDINTIGTSYANTNPLSLINPNDIESIDVLKDASASAIYGARAGNGVIIVKTKRAKSGKPQITLSGYAGATTRPNFREVLTGTAERELKTRLLNAQLPYSLIQLNNIPIQLTDSLNPAFNNDVDWQGLIVRERAILNSEDLSIAGISGTTSYRLSLNHYGEQGVLNGFTLQRLAPHLSLSFQPIRGMSISADILISSEKRKHGVGGSTGTLFNSWSFPSSLAQLSPAQQDVYKGNKSYYDDNKIFSIVGNIKLLDTLAKNFTITSDFSSSNYTDNYAYFSPLEVNGLQNQAYNIVSSSPSWTWENYLSYFKTIGNHNFTLVGGTSVLSNKSNFNYAYAKGIDITGINTLQTIPSGPDLFVSTDTRNRNTVSYYGRLLYDYKGKYLLTASLRRDASSIYSSNYRWGNFPSVSAGWIMSDEKFFEPVKKVVNFLKIRASWGITGNDPGDWYSKYQRLYSDASYLLSTTGTLSSAGTYVYLGGTPSSYNGTTTISPFPYYGNFQNAGVNSSSSVRWEKYPQTDFGADIELFNSRINLTFDWYQKDTKDKYFYGIPAQATSGYQNYSGNYVDIRNRGLEFSFSTRNLGAKSAFQWNTNFNISFNSNYITKLPNGNRDFLFGPSYFQQTLTYGEPLFNYKVWQINGAFATNDDVPTDPITGRKMTFQGATLQAGDPAYVDNNGDYNIDFDDKVIAGNPTPKVTGGFGNNFSYKGFSLNVFCSFLTGRKIFNGYLSDYLNGSRSYGAWGSVSGPAAITNLLDQFWVQPGDHTTFPRLVYPNGTAQDPWNIASSYFVENGDFLKVKQVTFGYTFSNRIVQKAGFKRLNVYGMADNLHVFKRSKIVPDPELVDPTTGSANVVYPTALKFTVGVNLEL